MICRSYLSSQRVFSDPRSYTSVQCCCMQYTSIWVLIWVPCKNANYLISVLRIKPVKVTFWAFIHSLFYDSLGVCVVSSASWNITIPLETWPRIKPQIEVVWCHWGWLCVSRFAQTLVLLVYCTYCVTHVLACPTRQAPHFSTSGYLLFCLVTNHSRCEQQCSTVLLHCLSEAYMVFQFVYKIYEFKATFPTNFLSSGFRIIAVFKYLHKA
jgi:hypothetical protein